MGGMRNDLDQHRLKEEEKEAGAKAERKRQDQTE